MDQQNLGLEPRVQEQKLPLSSSVNFECKQSPPGPYLISQVEIMIPTIALMTVHVTFLHFCYLSFFISKCTLTEVDVQHISGI